MNAQRKKSTPAEYRGYFARAEGQKLRSWTVGALPIANRVLGQMGLEDLLNQHLPPDGPGTKIRTSRALMLLVRNVLLSREPIYGLGEWAQRYAPDLIGIATPALKHLNDDRVGRALDRLFVTLPTPLIMDLTRRVIQHFQLSLDELHNDSTTVSFHGSYDDAREIGTRLGLPTPAITWGHSKDHRPDLKQLLYILTVTDDGGVPLYFTSTSGNVVDDNTHQETWDILRQLVSHSNFLYVADCKLASAENLKYIHRQGGRFITVLPRTRREDGEFRKRLLETPEIIHWEHVYDRWNADGETLIDSFRVATPQHPSADGLRVLWFHSAAKAQNDLMSRAESIYKARQQLTALQERLQAAKTRYRHLQKVEAAVTQIITETDTANWVRVKIVEQPREQFVQATKGRPSKDTKYVKRVEMRYQLEVEVDVDQMEKDRAGDGVFPLITNDPTKTPEEILRAYKRQPLVEKRFSQFKNDFHVAPVFLKSVTRIQGFLAIYFFVLMTQTLIERELRQAMEIAQIDDLPLYPESRACKMPTTRRLLDVFEPLQRHELTDSNGDATTTFVTQLTAVQRQILKLLKFTASSFGY